ncbi:hypothetical protein A2755_03770 [Candidatus Wolfebacteria bacterium RIFCSPHIGHO2_01_FULL_48_22]|uniref:Uncharacterized protein n=2 Tax=Candidatus Wolfeibacteriota TaxID=1752735 RepID=A0A1F8DPB7_9BACT|nr:MAG: hypothetical protein A2755_03770 [Candidatus Wolfebacteria bacterium RIFCSPHIGHO2_01_FULL_48_22]OGM93459.1 MAG: hypothetical protein A2935_01120 [Candidatus Wolfebacteria bacterium RIFCSPLOWO2_01_FULL_47_17b]
MENFEKKKKQELGDYFIDAKGKVYDKHAKDWAQVEFENARNFIKKENEKLKKLDERLSAEEEFLANKVQFLMVGEFDAMKDEDVGDFVDEEKMKIKDAVLRIEAMREDLIDAKATYRAYGGEFPSLASAVDELLSRVSEALHEAEECAKDYEEEKTKVIIGEKKKTGNSRNN